MSEIDQPLVVDTPPFDAGEFRRALGTFPTGVAIITTRGDDGRPVGLTCNSFSSVSLDPPLVLWSLRNASKSMPAFRGAPGFAINVLAEAQRDLSARFASGAIADKFEGVDHREGFGGVPLIEACVARFHCTTFAQHDAGDHVIFIGKVERFEHGGEQDPLVFYKGAYMMLAQSLRELAAQGRLPIGMLIEARAGVYELLLRQAAQRGEDADFDAMERHLAEMDVKTLRGDMAARALAALEYFELITRAAHNEVLALVAQTLATLMHHTVATQAAAMPYAAMHQPELTPLRRRMLGYLRARDADGAVDAMRQYFGHVEAFQRQVAKAA